MSSKLLERLSEEALPIFDECGCEIVDAEFINEGGQRILRFYAERKDGNITLDDCAAINQKLSERLDLLDTGTGSFILEISSPGIERPLKKPADYRRFMGNEVDIALYKPVGGKKKHSCILSGYDEEKQELAFTEGEEEFSAKLKDIAKITLHFNFS